MRGLPVLRWCSQHPWHDGPEGGLLAVLMTEVAAAPSVLHVERNSMGTPWCPGVPIVEDSKYRGRLNYRTRLREARPPDALIGPRIDLDDNGMSVTSSVHAHTPSSDNTPTLGASNASSMVTFTPNSVFAHSAEIEEDVPTYWQIPTGADFRKE